jgi:hypothetical protein
MKGRGAVLYAAAAVVLAAAVRGAPQTSYGRESQYEQLYGNPIDVSLTDLENNPEAYMNRAVRTRGRLEMGPSIRDSWILRDTFGSALIVPVNEIAANFRDESRTMMGFDISITGLVRQINSNDLGGSDLASRSPGTARIAIQFWSYEGPPEKPTADSLRKASPVTLESLVTNPGSRDNQMVRVVGKFRGSNLYGDLPSRSQRQRGDWVIKDEAFAVWITGKKPKGKGFDLDVSLKRDTGKWIEVVGRAVTRGGVTYVQALEVSLTGPPSATAQVLPPSPPPERPKVPPVIVFALPLDGDGEVPIDGRFIVQFNKDMEEGSFKNRVLLRYAGPVLPGDQPLNSTKVTYDRGRRALTVDPGMAMAFGRQVELVLLPGIVDTEGLPLISRTSPSADGATDVLRFWTGT